MKRVVLCLGAAGPEVGLCLGAYEFVTELDRGFLSTPDCRYRLATAVERDF
jgi:hypothetical protein